MRPWKSNRTTATDFRMMKKTCIAPINLKKTLHNRTQRIHADNLILICKMKVFSIHNGEATMNRSRVLIFFPQTIKDSKVHLHTQCIYEANILLVWWSKFKYFACKPDILDHSDKWLNMHTGQGKSYCNFLSSNKITCISFCLLSSLQ